MSEKCEKEILRVIQLISSWGAGGSESGLRLMAGMYRTDKMKVKIANFGAPPEWDEWWRHYGADYRAFPSRAPSWKCAVELYRYLKEEKPHVVDIYGLRMNLVGRIVAKLAGVPVVVCGIRQTDEWRKWYHIWLDRITSPLVDMYVSNSMAGYEVFGSREKIPARKRVVIPNGVQIKQFEPMLSKSDAYQKIGLGNKPETVFLTVARFRKEKAHSVLLEAIYQNRSKLENCAFLLAGEGPLLESSKALSKQYQLEKAVYFLRHREDIPLLMNASDVFVLPSLYEGMPRSVAEAMAARLPVIATRVSGTPELIDNEETGLLVEAGNVSELGHAIVYMKDNPQIAAKWAEAGYKKVCEEFDINNIVLSTQSLYLELLKHKIEKKGGQPLNL